MGCYIPGEGSEIFGAIVVVVGGGGGRHCDCLVVLIRWVGFRRMGLVCICMQAG